MIVIATPSRDLVNASFTYDLVQLIKSYPNSIFCVSFGTYLQNLRTSLVKQSIDAGASHILFVDSDMRFPPDTIDRLIKHDVDVVGANCSQRSADLPTARSGDGFVSSLDKSGLEEVDSLGFGVTLVKSGIFREMPEPWFGMPFDGEKYVGEDIFFCHQIKEKGFKIFVDHDLSQDVKHTGSIELGVK